LLLDEDGEDAPPLELDGLLAPLVELLAPVALDEPMDAEPEDSLTPSAASVFWSSLPEAWIPLDCWNSFTAAWVFGPSLPSAGPLSMPARRLAALSLSLIALPLRLFLVARRDRAERDGGCACEKQIGKLPDHSLLSVGRV